MFVDSQETTPFGHRSIFRLMSKADKVDGTRSRHLSAKMGLPSGEPEPKGPSDMQVTTVDLDLAKHVFQVHAIDASGQIVMRKALRQPDTPRPGVGRVIRTEAAHQPGNMETVRTDMVGSSRL